MLAIKTTKTEVKNAFDRIFNKLDSAEERINELKDVNRNWNSKKEKN